MRKKILFTEGVEAAYFGGSAELLRKVRYYLKNTPQRIKVAASGFLRANSSGYSNAARLTQIFAIIRN